MVYELKTKINDASVIAFLESIEDEEKKESCFKLLEIFTNISWHEWKMWWKSIVWFWTYTYKYASWQTWDWMRTWFAPRVGGISLYIMPGYEFWNMQELMENLWKYKAWKSCLNIKKLSDIDLKVLREIIKAGLEDMKERYPE